MNHQQMDPRERRAFSETLNVHYTVLYNLFEQSSYLKKKWGGDEKRERETHFFCHYGNKRNYRFGW